MAKPLLDGAGAEALALRYLQRCGLRLIARNWRCRYGEIDLLMRDGEVLVVVEVRYRSCSGFGGALGSVDRLKLLRLRRTLSCWLAAHARGVFGAGECRIDLIALQPLPADAEVPAPPGEPPELVVVDGKWLRLVWARGVG